MHGRSRSSGDGRYAVHAPKWSKERARSRHLLRQAWADAHHVGLHPLQRPHADAEDAGRGPLVAPDLLEDAPDVLALHVGQRRADAQLVARARCELDPEILARDDLPLRERRRALHDVLKLPDVAGPVVLVEPLESFLVEALDLLAHRATRTLQEVFRQQRDVLRALSEAGDSDRDDGE